MYSVEWRKKQWKILYKKLQKLYPERLTFLDYTTPWQLLVAVILSAQTTDVMVNRVTPELFRKYRSVDDMALAQYAELVNMIRKIGYHNAKSRYLINTAQILVRDHAGKVPNTMEELLQLPGVGRKTANVVLGNLYGMTTGIAVDTHVLRFASRFGLSDSVNANRVERDLIEVVPQKDWIKAGYYIKQYGRTAGRAEKSGYRPELDPLVKYRVGRV